MSTAAVADLRARLARMGGLARPAVDAVPTCARLPAPESAATGRLSQASVDGLAALGFQPRTVAAGTAWLREAAISLGPLLSAAGCTQVPAAASLRALAGLPAGGDVAAVLDIETLGLRGSGVIPFLVGVALVDGDELRVRQLLLADLGAEGAMFDVLGEVLGAADTLVTYNGRTFDGPVLRARHVLTRRPPALEALVHCDLLGSVRRLFRARLGQCTLRRAEEDLLGLLRSDDLPGSEAPARYQRYLLGGEVGALGAVVRHNQLDLAATLVLGARLVAHVDGDLVAPPHPADRYQLARHLERCRPAGWEVLAEAHDRAVVAARVSPWDRGAALRLARGLGRTPAGRAEALTLLRALVAADPTDLRAARALAVLAERCRHLEEAHAVSLRALEICLRLGPRLQRMRGAPAGGWAAEWERRCARLCARRGSLLPIAG